MKNMSVFIIILGCLSAFVLGGCADRGAVLESDYYVQIHGKAEKNENKNNYVYNLEGYNEKGKKKMVSFFVEKPYQEGDIVRVPRSYDGYTGEPEAIKSDKVPEKIKDRFNLEI
ncbi:YxeA family protein [Bacillus atrophaeus]|uniref:YxeA family protein n=1 Tax=Bacillus atrophaeus TaxID=1452 RepID=UPI0022828E7E|nr:YxeA family protein [Bacillus atrophaeus]MCY8934682.1 YxeA family protein [Bacillus atrophaeus]MCY8944337.1 YxeA family protein [Bacillus atrophaeus]MCY8945535.1 YxeA family protein [Bacillus atrophaeus]